jgi:SAM-dependent methyltransferase
VSRNADFERGAGSHFLDTGDGTVPRESVLADRFVVANTGDPRSNIVERDHDDRPYDLGHGDWPRRRRWRTPEALYRLISTPLLRAALGWDLARWDVRWVPARSGTCLEVGSNGGFYTGALARHLCGSAKLVSLEPHHSSLVVLRRRLADRRGATMRQVCGDGTRLPFADCSVDVVFLGYCLEEMPDPYRAVAEAYRVLRPGGRLVVFLWRPAITRRWREPVVARLRELFDVERERFGLQNIRLCFRRSDPADAGSVGTKGPAAGGVGNG